MRTSAWNVTAACAGSAVRHRGSPCALCCLQGMQLFGYKFSSCSVDGAQQLCPPGTPSQDYPVYPDCYVPCQESQAFSWVNVTGRQCMNWLKRISFTQSPGG